MKEILQKNGNEQKKTKFHQIIINFQCLSSQCFQCFSFFHKISLCLFVFIIYLLWCIHLLLLLNFWEFISLFAFYSTFAAYLLNAHIHFHCARDFFRCLFFSQILCALWIVDDSKCKRSSNEKTNRNAETVHCQLQI